MTYGRCPNCGRKYYTYTEARDAYVKDCKCGASIIATNLSHEFWNAVNASVVKGPVKMIVEGHFPRE